ncbi:hypothetical protein GCM10022226_40880 [Sphaerisporangium flaviroseum]|uniref:Ig-like domain-containing protein n=1 Tax=Sphaerisporangium flaviroseum TaxID=509199 RepID=A0ABP7IDV2_9ACTN
MFWMGPPMGTDPGGASRASISWTQHPTTVSVGPYSFTTTVPGASPAHCRTVGPGSASPPTISRRVAPAACSGESDAHSISRWAGVSLTRLCPPPSSASASARTPGSSRTTVTVRPAVSTGKIEVTLRSKAMEECSVDPRPPSTSYALAAQVT